MAKQYTWHGKTESELTGMDLTVFTNLVPARPRRSLKRGFTDAQKSLLRRIAAGDNNIKTHCRDMVILPSMVGKMLRIHNGKDWEPVSITPDMLGHYLGEFSMTRKPVTNSSAGVGATRSSKAISAR